MPRPKKYKIKPVHSPELKTWDSLNKAIPGAGRELCLKLLKEEKAGRKRGEFLRRIAARIARLRREAEMDRLLKPTEPKGKKP